MRREVNICVLVGGLLALTGCGAAAGAQVQPDPLQPSLYQGGSELEQAWLAALERTDTTPAPVVLETGIALGPAYYAASGRLCRHVRARGEEYAVEKLACKDHGQWYFVPDVFPPGLVAEAQP